MKHVAFFRNLNLGHPRCPSGTELVYAFGGSDTAESFQTNGTVIFETDSPHASVALALRRLRSSGYGQTPMIRRVEQLSHIVTELPEIDPAEGVYRGMLSFFDVEKLPAVTLPLRSPDQLVEVRRLTSTHAWSGCWKPRSTAGDTTGFLESILRGPVTTRTTATIQRLVRKYAA